MKGFEAEMLGCISKWIEDYKQEATQEFKVQLNGQTKSLVLTQKCMTLGTIMLSYSQLEIYESSLPNSIEIKVGLKVFVTAFNSKYEVEQFLQIIRYKQNELSSGSSK